MNRSITWRVLLFLGVIGLCQQTVAQVVRFVDASSPGGNGSTWGAAFRFLQDALEAAGAGDEIWVANGTYYPPDGLDNPPPSREASFELRNNVDIYGGFAGNESSLSERDPVANITTLSGDIGIPGNNNDNSLNVVKSMGGVTSSTILDGFTITRGFAIGIGANGTGMLIQDSSPNVVRCTFDTNGDASTTAGGAAMVEAIEGPTPAPKFVNCSFINNHSNYGGAVYCAGATPVFANCLFRDNGIFANQHGGALAVADGTSAALFNCTFARNSVAEGGMGAAIWINNTGPITLANCVIWGNNPANNPIHVVGTPPPLIFEYNDIQGGGWPGEGNIDADPVFADPDGPDNTPGNSDDDFRLGKLCSPCIDAGDPDDGGTVNSSCSLPGTDYNVPCALACPVAGGRIPCDDPWDVDQDGTTGEPTPDLRFGTISNSLDRVLDGDGEGRTDGELDDDARIDMGSYEFVRPCCPWDCQVAPNGSVGQADLNALLGQWGQTCTTCDFGLGASGVGNDDKTALLDHWGPCNNCTAAGSGGGSGGPMDGPTGSGSDAEELEGALWLMGFASLDAYQVWSAVASDAENYASLVVLLALLGGN